MIVFENPGVIDMTAVTTFGVSVKETENPIGYFGTGLKYAIAILLREECSIAIQAGIDRYEFGVEKDSVRGKEFEFVTMSANGGEPTRLGFTTDVGKNWKLWQAYRELYCNARDESGDAYRCSDEPDRQHDTTQVIVIGDQVETIHNERWKYFVEGEPEFEFGGIEMQRKPSRAYFYRGVQIFELPRGTMYTYNDTRAIELTEDRSAKEGWWGIHYRLISAIKSATDKDFFRAVLTAPDSVIESDLDYDGWGGNPSEQFLRVVGDLVREKDKNLNETARKVWEARQPAVFAPRDIESPEARHRISLCRI